MEKTFTIAPERANLINHQQATVSDFAALAKKYFADLGERQQYTNDWWREGNIKWIKMAHRTSVICKVREQEKAARHSWVVPSKKHETFSLGDVDSMPESAIVE